MRETHGRPGLDSPEGGVACDEIDEDLQIGWMHRVFLHAHEGDEAIAREHHAEYHHILSNREGGDEGGRP